MGVIFNEDMVLEASGQEPVVERETEVMGKA